MNLPKWHRKIYNAETGEETIIPYTADEIVIAEAEQAKFEEQLAKQAAEQAAKAEQRAALLERLGITEEEAKLLLG